MKKLILIAALLSSPSAFAELAFDKAVGIFERYAHQCDKKAYRNHVPTECVMAAKYAKTLGEMHRKAD